MTRNEEALELYRAQADLEAAHALLMGAVDHFKNAHDHDIRWGLDSVFQRIESAKQRIKNVSDPFGTPSPELPNVIEAIRNHPQVA